MKVIVINGKPTAGKSTFIKLCNEIAINWTYSYKDYNYQVFELSMVDFVKDVALYAGWDKEKDKKGRKFLADIKNAIESYDKTIIYDNIDEFIQNEEYWIDENNYNFYFINARNPEDIKYLVNKYNAISLFIDNPNVPMVESNSEDKNIENYKYDITIVNDGTLEDLKAKAKEFLSSLK